MSRPVPHIKKILKTELEGFRVTLLFSDGAQGIVDLSDTFQRREEIIEEVLHGNLFEECFVESGALAWPNGLELCPFDLRMKLVKEKSSRVKKRKQTAA